MNGLSSECSSGCESGWTMYLDQSSLSANPCKGGVGFVNESGVFCKDYKEKGAMEEEEEEDLSMVSDASSGPPHFNEDEDYCNENGCFSSASSAAALVNKSGKRRKMEGHQRQQQEQLHPSFLDDTASSPNNFKFTNNQASMENVLDFSQGFSATQNEERSIFYKHFAFLQSSLPGKPTSAKPVKLLRLLDGFDFL
ncbi:hypothetical protein HHK36_008271 [Tetracentron sinense]|uniref:Uncharacterized protein n=1 Tax=Tetracentron sinense TaxID=13715 RepID=A0A834ZM67_TETSI|nr:hypothetical protein HHK36_008271 [Tetracentron sinense]